MEGFVNSAVLLAPHFPEYCWNYAKALAERMPVTLFCDRALFQSEVGEASNLTTRAQVRLVEFGSPSTILAVLREVARLRPTFVHFQEATGRRKAIVNAVLATWLKGRTPTVLTIHDPKPHSGNDSPIAARTRWLRNIVRMRADAAVLHGAFCSALYDETRRPAAQTVVTSVHGTILQPSLAQRRAPSQGQFLFFGRMEAYKGLDVLTSTLELLRSQGRSVQVIVAGSGPELRRLGPRLAASGAEIIDRYLSRDETIELMQRSQAVLVPYKDATQSGVVAAAFANGRTVIASRVGGLIDAVNDGTNGILIEPNAAAALGRAMLCLADDPAKAIELCAGAEAAAVGELNWDRIVEHLLYKLSVLPMVQ
jgi:glycosyltransferase involved in cell wall biosynthesis